jgi:transcriptional regulator with XRE-family HTH domain
MARVCSRSSSALREQAGLSQQQLADRIGLTQRAYAYWERHPVALRPDQLLKVADALNVSVEDLVGTNGKKNEEPVQPAECVSYSKRPRACPAANNRRSPPA